MLAGLSRAGATGAVTAARERMGHDRGSGAAASGRARRRAEINDTIRYTMWSVFAVRAGRCRRTGRRWPPRSSRSSTELAAKDLDVRGWYDVAGLRADADLMVWWHAPRSRRCSRPTTPAAHGARPAPAAGLVGGGAAPAGGVQQGPRPGVHGGRGAPRVPVCVYPFVRSYEWYLLPDEERRRMLAEHGMAARTYPDVRANTVARSRSATTSGCSRSRPTSCTASST